MTFQDLRIRTEGWGVTGHEDTGRPGFRLGLCHPRASQLSDAGTPGVGCGAGPEFREGGTAAPRLPLPACTAPKPLCLRVLRSFRSLPRRPRSSNCVIVITERLNASFGARGLRITHGTPPVGWFAPRAAEPAVCLVVFPGGH